MLRLRISKENETPTINMTPMIDMVFQILIFFLLTSILVAQPVIDLILPEADHTKGKEEKNEFHIFISKTGKVFLGGENITMENLPHALRENIEAVSKKSLILSVEPVEKVFKT